MSTRINEVLLELTKELTTLKNFDTSPASHQQIRERYRLLRTTRARLGKVKDHLRLLERDVVDVVMSSDDEEDLMEVEREVLKDVEKGAGGEWQGYHSRNSDHDHSGHEDDDTATVRLDNLPNENAKLALVSKRFRECLKNMDDLGYPTSQLIRRVLNDQTGSLRKQEDSAFRNLNTRYLNPGASIFDDVYRPFVESSTWKDIRNQIWETEKLDSLEERLVTRETVMFNVRTGNAVESWVFGVIETVNGLVLALEWNDLTNKAGGKKLKGVFRNRLFEAMKGGGIDGAGQDFRSGRALASEKTKFARMHRKIVTSRNHTPRLYEMFGATVVIEPVFNPMSGLVARGWTPTFSHLLNHVIEHFRLHVEEAGALKPEEGEDMDAAYKRYMVARHESAVAVIRDLFSRFAPPGLMSWVIDFLTRHPPNYTGPMTQVVDD